MSESTTVARQQLMTDLKAVVADTEELLKATAGAAGDRVAAARARAEGTLKAAKEKLAGLDEEVLERAKHTAKATDEYVHEHPWSAIGIAAAAGLLVGVLIARR
jgi:ElaB/YqjD/DUF883 family membrane-anchored ribosome-binding protein